MEESIKNQADFSALSILKQIEFIAKQYYLFLTNQELSYTINAYRSQLILGNTYVGNKTRFSYLATLKISERWIQTNRLKHTWNAEELADFISRCIRGIAYDWCSKEGTYDLLQIGIKELNIIFEGLMKD